MLARTPTAVKDAALEAIARALEERLAEILAANELDMEAGREADIGDALLDRLRSTRGASARSRLPCARSRRWPTRSAR